MKTATIFSLLIILTIGTKAQNINIPDTIFLKELIKLGVDKNNDKLISMTEAQADTSMDLDACDVALSDLTGIEYFINIKTLFCPFKSISKVDLSKNIALREFQCSGNNITSLEFSKNLMLQKIGCSQNPLTKLDVTKNLALQNLQTDFCQLTSLDLSKNTSLTYLICSDNQLTNINLTGATELVMMYCENTNITNIDLSTNTKLQAAFLNSNLLTKLDVTKNTDLNFLKCNYNKITSLNLSNNKELLNLSIQNMSSLKQVCVFELPYHFVINKTNSPNVTFTTNCPVETSEVSIISEKSQIYPNPTNGIINVEYQGFNYAEVFNINGELLTNFRTYQFDFSNYPFGLYLVRIYNKQGESFMQKIIYQ